MQVRVDALPLYMFQPAEEFNVMFDALCTAGFPWLMSYSVGLLKTMFIHRFVEFVQFQLTPFVCKVPFRYTAVPESHWPT